MALGACYRRCRRESVLGGFRLDVFEPLAQTLPAALAAAPAGSARGEDARERPLLLFVVAGLRWIGGRNRRLGDDAQGLTQLRPFVCFREERFGALLAAIAGGGDRLRPLLGAPSFDRGEFGQHR